VELDRLAMTNAVGCRDRRSERRQVASGVDLLL
jgi:hypothetical protein